MMKRLFGFLACFMGGSLLLLALSLTGCYRSDRYFIYNEMTVDVVQLPLADSNAATILMEGDTATSGRFFVNGELAITELEKVTASHFRPGNALYALKLQEPAYRNLEGKIADIRVIALYDYKETYPAGADLSNACSFSSRMVLGDTIFTDKAAFIEACNQPMENGWSYYFSSFQVAPPEVSSGSRQQLAIEVRMEQNTVIRDTTVIFYLKP